MLLTGEQLVAALGKPFDDPAVQVIAEQLGLRAPRVSDGGSEDALEAKPRGMQLGFSVIGGDPTVPMLLTAITCYVPGGEPGYGLYTGGLPGDASLGDTPEHLVEKLGSPESVDEDDGVVWSRGWKRDGYYMTFSYGAEGEIRYVQLIWAEYIDS